MFLPVQFFCARNHNFGPFFIGLYSSDGRALDCKLGGRGSILVKTHFFLTGRGGPGRAVGAQDGSGGPGRAVGAQYGPGGPRIGLGARDGPGERAIKERRAAPGRVARPKPPSYI